MAFENWPAFLVYGLGYAVAAAFLIAHRRDVIGRTSVKVPKDLRHAEAAQNENELTLRDDDAAIASVLLVQ